MTRTKPTRAQAATLALLQADGFSVVHTSPKAIKVAKGNDFRLVQLDGQQKRALGARR